MYTLKKIKSLQVLIALEMTCNNHTKTNMAAHAPLSTCVEVASVCWEICYNIVPPLSPIWKSMYNVYNVYKWVDLQQ